MVTSGRMVTKKIQAVPGGKGCMRSDETGKRNTSNSETQNYKPVVR